MTQTSGFWTTAGTPSGHQVSNYTQAIWSKAMKIVAACSGFEGVAPGQLNELNASSPGSNQVDIDTGWAVADGKWYENDAAVSFDSDDLPNPSGGTSRIDRIVLRVLWSAYTAILEVVSGTESAGTPSAPTVTQTPGTDHAIYLWQVLVEDDGSITLTDERDWAIVPIDGSTIENNDGQLRVPDGGITAAKIANRTRTFFVPAVESYEQVNGDRPKTTVVGYHLSDTYEQSAFGNFYVPSDFSASLSIRPILYSVGGTGNIYYKTDVQYGAIGEAFNNHAHLGSYAALGLTNDVWQLAAAVSLTSAAIGDLVSMRFYRDGSHASDTYSGFAYIVGFQVSYTADS